MNWIATTILLLSAASTLQAQELLTPAIKGVVAANTPIEFIKDGFQGTEGPLPLPTGGMVFTEWQGTRIIHVADDGSTSTYVDLGAGNGVNSLAFNKQGELLAILATKPTIDVVYPQDKARTVVDGYQGKAFGRLNDLVVDKHGGVYFTDMGINTPAGQPVPDAPPAAGVYYLNAQGELLQLDTSVARPNGIQLSPDEKTLYVANTWGEYVLAYDVNKNGTLGAHRDFAKLEGFSKNAAGVMTSGADGLAIDTKGRVYVASSLGVQVFDNKGAALGIIALPKVPNNLAFGGPGKKMLYVVGRGSVWRIATQTKGYAGRAK
jgi:gluconolactonase